MTLFITTNVVQCERFAIFPLKESDLEKEQLVKILALTKFNVPKEWPYYRIVRSIVARLNSQKPLIYAIDDGQNVILDSYGMEVNKEGLVYGSQYLKQKIDSKKCENIWQSFYEYYHKSFQSKYNPPKENNKHLLKAKEEIISLQVKMKNMEKKLQENNTNQEYEAKLIYCETELDEKVKQYEILKEKNRKLLLQISSSKARELTLEKQLEECRNQLQKNPEKIEELQNIKNELNLCKEEKKKILHKLQFSFA
jgi:hypothetical protein